MPWKAAFTHPHEKDAILSRLSIIADDLLRASNQRVTGQGLFGGTEGMLLFFLYYYKLTEKEKYLHQATRLLEELFDAASTNSFSFSGGTAGLGWLFEHVCQHGFVDAEPNEVIGDLDEGLYDVMLTEIRKGNYDYLHGALGIGLYFIARKGLPVAAAYLDELIGELSRISIRDEDGSVKWTEFKENKFIEGQYNLGLSHGIPSIVAFLTLMSKVNPHNETTLPLLVGGVNYILKNQLRTDARLSCFPYTVSSHNDPSGRGTHSRLAWCYGDLGICAALCCAAELTGNELLKTKVHEILNGTVQRKDLAPNMVYDAGLCHGTAGIAHVFLRMYNYTGTEIFRDAAVYWFQQTLAMSKFDDGISGYKSYSPHSGEYTSTPGLLEGTAGIGLALIASVSEFAPDWDRCLLLS